MSRKIDPALIPPFPTLQYEAEAWRKGHLVVAGLDEAGRGALAVRFVPPRSFCQRIDLILKKNYLACAIQSR